jgi:hypothetical protein
MSYGQSVRAVQDALAAAGVALTTGTVRYVRSTVGINAVSSGSKPSDPYASIDYAIGQCDASKGDVIVVLPGHTEAITAAGGITCDVAGITIVGIGTGRNRPTITWSTATAATLLVTASNVTIKNIYMDMTGIDAVASGISVTTGTDFALDGCEIEFADSGGQATLAMLTEATADRLRITNCKFFGSADAGTAAAIRIVGGNDHVITDNVIFGNFTTTLGGIDNATTAGLRWNISRNLIANNTASSTIAVVLQSGTTGHVTNNRFAIRSGTAPVTAAGAFMGGNVYVAAAGVTAGTAATF